MRALIVGEAPSRPLDGRAAFSGGPCATRLSDLLGVDRVDRVASTANLFTVPVARWSVPHARVAARVLLRREGAERLILCGRRVASAFGVTADWLEWERQDDRMFGVLPHPSGRNLWWNEAENVEAARAWIRHAVDRAAWLPA